MRLVQLSQQLNLPRLLVAVEAFVPQVREHLVRLKRFGVDRRALVFPRQEAAADQPPISAPQRDEARQVLVLTAQAVGDPRPEAGMDGVDPAGRQVADRGLMVRRNGVHRADDAQVVDAVAQMGQQVADEDAALAARPEAEWRGIQPAGGAFGADFDVARPLACELVDFGLGVKQVDVRRAAVHEEEDHAFGAGRKVRLRTRRAQRLGRREIARNSERADAGPETAHKFAAVERLKSLDHLRLLVPRLCLGTHCLAGSACSGIGSE